MGALAVSPDHTPVLTRELIEGLAVVRGGRYVDCTLGAGAHGEAVLEAAEPGGRLLGIDADLRALRLAERRLSRFQGAFLLVNANFANLQEICINAGFSPVHGVYFDLGLSSMQLEEPGRGFSFQRDDPLDMRFSDRQQVTAAEIVNRYPEETLARVLWTYGEERRSRAIARRIVARRPLRTTGELARIVAQGSPQRGARIHPATRVFQALRIAVNDELASLQKALRSALEILGGRGRLCVISYHSLEDRIVKQFMQLESKDCVCPPPVPACVCGHKATLRTITRRVVTPSLEEVRSNPRSRSAKLRVAERL